MRLRIYSRYAFQIIIILLILNSKFIYAKQVYDHCDENNNEAKIYDDTYDNNEAFHLAEDSAAAAASNDYTDPNSSDCHSGSGQYAVNKRTVSYEVGECAFCYQPEVLLKDCPANNSDGVWTEARSAYCVVLNCDECFEDYPPLPDKDKDGWPDNDDPFPDNDSEMTVTVNATQDGGAENGGFSNFTFTNADGDSTDMEIGDYDITKDTEYNIDFNDQETIDYDDFYDKYLKTEPEDPIITIDSTNDGAIIDGVDITTNETPINNSNESALLSQIAESNQAIQNNQKAIEQQIRNNTENANTQATSTRQAIQGVTEAIQNLSGLGSGPINIETPSAEEIAGAIETKFKDGIGEGGGYTDNVTEPDDIDVYDLDEPIDNYLQSLKNLQVFDFLNNSGFTLSGTTSIFKIENPLNSEIISFDLSQWEQYFNLFGTLLLSFTTLKRAIYVFTGA